MSKKILWIDDEEPVLWLAKEEVQVDGWEFDYVQSNDLALKHLKKNHYDLLIQDIVRPPGDCLTKEETDDGWATGVVFYEKFISKKLPKLPIVFFTAITSPHLYKYLEKYNNCCAITKSTVFDSLTSQVESIFSENREGLYRFASDYKTSNIITVDFSRINNEIIQHLSKNPVDIHKLTPRRFEELVAHLFTNLGYETHLTQQSRDGGADIYAIHRSDVGELFYLIECKKYSPNNPVGVSHLRSLYGVKNQMNATAALLITTSFFTSPAKAFQNSIKYELSLKDYDGIEKLLKEYKPN